VLMRVRLLSVAITESQCTRYAAHAIYYIHSPVAQYGRLVATRASLSDLSQLSGHDVCMREDVSRCHMCDVWLASRSFCELVRAAAVGH
jgi:hypothetical protein